MTTIVTKLSPYPNLIGVSAAAPSETVRLETPFKSNDSNKAELAVDSVMFIPRKPVKTPVSAEPSPSKSEVPI